MTAEQAAQSLGISAETLVQEVISKQTVSNILLTALFALVMLGAIVATVKLMLNVRYSDVAPIAFTCVCAALICVLLSADYLIDWLAAPETTVREYIIEHYGGDARWN